MLGSGGGEGADDDDRHGLVAHEGLEKGDSVHAGHFDVEGEDVGAELADFFASDVGIDRGADHFDVGVGGQPVAERLTSQRRVVDDEHADGHEGSGFDGDEGLEGIEVVVGFDHVAGEVDGGEADELEGVGASAEGEGVMAIAEAHEVGDEVAEVDEGGEAFVTDGFDGVVVVPDGGDEVVGEFPTGEEAAADFGVLDAEDFGFAFEEGGLVDFDFAGEALVAAFEGLGEEDFADIVEDGGGEDDAFVGAGVAGHAFGGEGGGDAVAPETAFVDAVAFGGGLEGTGADDGDDEFVDGAEADSDDGFEEVGDGGGEAEGGAIAEAEDGGGEAWVAGDEFDDGFAVCFGEGELVKQFGEDDRGWGEGLDPVDVGVEALF